MQVEIKIDDNCIEPKVIIVTDKVTDVGGVGRKGHHNRPCQQGNGAFAVGTCSDYRHPRA